MTKTEALTLFEREDLTEIGMQADARRRELHPDGIVTYCVDEEAAALRISLTVPEEAIAQIDKAQHAGSIVPVCARSYTATEYLRFLAICRLYSPVLHIELDPDWAGLKVAQMALRFGADDFGNRKPNSPIPEEEVRRTIRDAGFIPKRRDRLFQSLSLY